MSATFHQLTLFSPPPEELPPADESLEQLMREWTIKQDGTLIRRHPVPFTRDWYDQQNENDR
jgi:hypothetical protein